MTTAQVLLRDLLRTHVAPVLREHGYAGSGQDFHRRIAGNWAAINVQRSRSDTADEVRWTINLGTASTVVRLEDGFPADEPAKEIECHWRSRVGQLLPRGQDVWWTVTSRMTPEQLQVMGETTVGHLVEHALPKLQEMAADPAILATVLTGEPRPGIVPAGMDVIGPILRAIGPPDRFARFLAVCDQDGKRAASLYELFDDYPPAALGPARIRKRLDDLSRTGFEPRQQAIADLGWAKPTDEIKAALRPFLDDPEQGFRFAAAASLARLGDVTIVPRLLAMVVEEPARFVAVHAAFALTRLDPLLSAEQQAASRDAIRARRERAVGHDRAALSELLRRLGSG